MLQLLLITGLLLYAAVVAGVLRALARPQPRSVGWCLARGRPSDPSELAVPFKPVTFTLADGATTRGWVLTGGTADGPVAVLVHGHGGSRFQLLHETRNWLPHTSRVVVYDQRGHHTARPSSFGALEPADLAAIVEQTLGRDEPLVLVGHSLGAAAVLTAAAREPSVRHRLVGLVLLGAFRFARDAVAGVLRERRLPAAPVAPVVMLWLRLRWRGRPYDPTRDLLPEARRIAVPTLILHGRRDHVSPLPAAESLYHAVPDGLATMDVFDDAAHGGLDVIDPQRYRLVVDSFMQRVADARRAATPPPSPENAHP